MGEITEGLLHYYMMRRYATVEFRYAGKRLRYAAVLFRYADVRLRYANLLRKASGSESERIL
jgi:hypothetical protein